MAKDRRPNPPPVPPPTRGARGREERRTGSRASLVIPVSCRYESVLDFVDTQSMNISRTGMFIMTDAPPALGSRVEFEFTLADGYTLLRGLAEVVRVVTRGAVNGMGVRFIELDEANRALIDRIVTVNDEEGRNSTLNFDFSRPATASSLPAVRDEDLAAAAAREAAPTPESPGMTARLRGPELTGSVGAGRPNTAGASAPARAREGATPPPAPRAPTPEAPARTPAATAPAPATAAPAAPAATRAWVPSGRIQTGPAAAAPSSAKAATEAAAEAATKAATKPATMSPPAPERPAPPAPQAAPPAGDLVAYDGSTLKVTLVAATLPHFTQNPLMNVRSGSFFVPAPSEIALGTSFGVEINDGAGKTVLSAKGKVIAKQDVRIGVRIFDADRDALARLQAEVGRLAPRK